MFSRSKIFILVTLLGFGTSCVSGRYSSAGFHLPSDGDAARGKKAFVELGCTSCHAVAGTDLSATVARPAAFLLGGEVDKKLSHAYLMTSMLDPAYELAPHSKSQTNAQGVSRMPNYTDRMSARQVVDLVAFLQSHYQVRQMPPTYGFR